MAQAGERDGTRCCFCNSCCRNLCISGGGIALSITILGTTFTIVNAGAVVGAGLGFVVGLGLAIDNTCLDFTNGFQDSAYTSCD